MNDMTPATATPADLIEEYLRLREGKTKAEDAFKGWVETHYSKRMDEIEALLLGFFEAQKSESINTKVGTAYRSLASSATILDPKEFQRHVIGSGAWELIDWRANKTAALEFLEQNKAEPPGVKISHAYRVGVRRPSK